MQPRASRDGIVGWREGALAIRVTALPLEGEANRAVTELLARALGVRRSAVTVVHGERGRDKVVRVDGLSAADVERRLGAPSASASGPATSPAASPGRTERGISR